MAAKEEPMVTVLAVVVDKCVHVTLAPLTVHGDWVWKSVVKVIVSPLLLIVALVSILTSTTATAPTSWLS